MTKEEMLELRSMMEEVVQPIREDIAELKTDVAGLKTDVAELKTDVAKLKTDMVSVEDRLTRLELTQENVIIPQIQLLAEGHQSIIDHIDIKIENAVSGITERVDVLEVVVKQHSKDIAELKRAL